MGQRVADADHREFVDVGVLADHTGMSTHALPRPARRDAHFLVVVAVARQLMAVRNDAMHQGRVPLGALAGIETVGAALVVGYFVGRLGMPAASNDQSAATASSAAARTHCASSSST